MATPGQDAALADRHRTAQALLAAILTRDVLAVWLTLDLANVKASWPLVRTAVLALIGTSFAESLLLGTQYYRDARALAGLAGAAPEVSVSLDPVKAVRALDVTGPGTLLHDIKIGQSALLAMQHAGVRISGASGNIALGAGRTAILELVKEDKKAIGWARRTSGNPCYFCAMLASRGAVYRTEQSAAFLAHEHCHCTPAPGFRKEDLHSPVSEALLAEWQRITKKLSGKDAMNAWRRYWEHEADVPAIMAAA